MKIAVPIEALALWRFAKAAGDPFETRPALTSVRVEPYKGGAVAVATDGMHLCAYAWGDHDFEWSAFSVGRDFAKTVTEAGHDHAVVDTSAATISAGKEEGIRLFAPVSETLRLDWMVVFEGRNDLVPVEHVAILDAGRLSDFGKYLSDTGRPPGVYLRGRQSGGDPGYVPLWFGAAHEPNVHYTLMPMRGDRAGEELAFGSEGKNED